MLSIVAPSLLPNRYCSPITSWLLSLLLQTSLSACIRNTTVTYREVFFSPTEMPHCRHEKGGIGRNWRQVCSTSSWISMQYFWHHFHPFHHHHHLSWFAVHKFSPPPLKCFRGGLWARMVHMQWSLIDMRRIRLSAWTVRSTSFTYENL